MFSQEFVELENENLKEILEADSKQKSIQQSER